MRTHVWDPLGGVSLEDRIFKIFPTAYENAHALAWEVQGSGPLKYLPHHPLHLISRYVLIHRVLVAPWVEDKEALALFVTRFFTTCAFYFLKHYRCRFLPTTLEGYPDRFVTPDTERILLMYLSKDIPNRLKIHQPKKPLTSPFSFRILLLKSLPSRHRKSSPGCKIPHLVAIARAVLILSPVTIRTVIPALWHFFIASGTWFTRTQFTLGKKISTAERGEIPLSKHTLPRSCTNDNCMSSPDTISWRAPNNLFFPLPLPLPYFRLQSQFSSDLTGRHYFFAKGLGKRLPPVDHQAILSWLAFYPSGSTAQTRPE